MSISMLINQVQIYKYAYCTNVASIFYNFVKCFTYIFFSFLFFFNIKIIFISGL